MKLKKIEKMVIFSFKNALRLHKDSILLYKNGSFPSAFQLSVLAQEEIGKTFFLEDHCFHAYEFGYSVDQIESFKLTWKVILSHRSKQGCFDHHNFKDNFLKEILAKQKLNNKKTLEEDKQNATYVGLPLKKKSLNFNGKIIIPEKIINKKRAFQQITKVNDFLIDLCEGYCRGFYMVDTPYLSDFLTIGLAFQLKNSWSKKHF